MKKKSFGLVLLISVLIVVIVLYSFVMSVVNRDDGENGGGSTEIVYIDRQEDDVSRVTYNDGSSTFTIKRSGSVYLLDEDEEFPLNTTAARFMVNVMAKIVFERRLNPEGSDISTYGLDNAQRVISAIYTDGAKVTMNIGNYNEYADAYYCSVGDGFVYLLSGEFTDAFEYTFTDLLQDDTVETPQYGFTSLTSIEITDKNGTVVLRPVEGTENWSKTNADGKTEPGEYSDVAQLIYRELYMLQVDEWVSYNAEDDESRDKYGLKTPEIRVLFNHVEEVEISNEGSATITKEYARTTAFLIGYRTDNELEEGESASRYFMFGDGSVVYVISEDDMTETLGAIK